MNRETGNDHSNPLSKVFSKIFHHDDKPTPQPAPPARDATPVQASSPLIGAAAQTATVAPTAGQVVHAAATPTVTPSSSARSYTVQAGDSLSKIAQQVYGDASQWTHLYDANRATISNPDRIFPGQVLVLPDAPKPH